MDTDATEVDRLISRRNVLAATAATGAATFGLAGPSSAAGRRPRGPRVADAVVLNGDVLVMDRAFRRAEAVAIRDGRILAVGRSRQVQRLIGRRTEVLDAAGATVLPGINDSHLHLNGFALTLPPLSYGVDTATLDALVAIVRDAVAEAATPTQWIRGQGWNDNRLPRPPDRRDLDPVSGEHPVILTDFSFHAIAVNSKAVELAGITRDTVPPAGGVIERDADGEPTGVLRETAQGLVSSIVPPRTRDEIARGIAASVRTLHARGITSVTDPGIGIDTLDLYEELAGRGELPLRVTALLSGGTSVEQLRSTLDAYRPLRGVDPTRLRVGGVKLFADGIPTAARTAWLHEPYLDGTNGSLVLDGSTVEEQVDTLHRMIRMAHHHRLQVGTHATGDATIDAVVEGYLRAMGRHGRRTDLRHYVIHGDLTPAATLRQMARHDIGVNMNGTIKYLLGRTLDPVLGPERTDYQWPYRSALDAGVRVSSSSDAPVTGPDWLQGVMAMRLREGMFGGVAGEAERISVPEALATYTRTPAWQDHAARWKGTLQVGRVADLCILDGDLLGTPPRELPGLDVVATLVGGEVVYDASAAGSATRRTRAAAASASALSHSSSVACLQDGRCCCALTDQLMA